MPEHLREFIAEPTKKSKYLKNTEQPEMQRYCDPEDEALPGAIGGRRYQVCAREAEHRAGDQQKTARQSTGRRNSSWRGRGPPFCRKSGCQAIAIAGRDGNEEQQNPEVGKRIRAQPRP